MAVAEYHLGIGFMETTLRSGNIRNKIPRKADNLLEDNSEERNDRRVLGEFFETVHIKK